MSVRKKVWVGYGVFEGREIMTNAETGQLAIFSNLFFAQYSYPYLEKDGRIIMKLYMSKETPNG